jgi:hypothetical protein
MSAVNTLRLVGATLHVGPAEDHTPGAIGYDLQVITADGVQVIIKIDSQALQAAADEASAVLLGNPASFHAAGMRLQDRLNRIKRT